MTHTFRKCLLATALALALTACKTTIIVDPYFRPADAQVERAYISPTAEFRNYKRLMARPLEVYYPDNVPAPSQAELDRLRGIFREAFLEAVGDDYEVVSTAGPDVMLVSGQIVDLKVLGANGTYVASGRLSDVVAKGQLTLLLEFRDSVSERVLARAGEASQGDATSRTDEAASWAQVEAAAARWAQLFKSFLDRNLGQPG